MRIGTGNLLIDENMSEERAIIDDMLTDIYRYRRALKEIAAFAGGKPHAKGCSCGWPTCVAQQALIPRVRESEIKE